MASLRHDHKISKIGLKRLQDENPEKFNPLKSYGIIPRQPRPADTAYFLEYDTDKSYLKINGVVVRRFNFESNADLAFKRLFKNKSSREQVRRIVLKKPARAGVIVNNTGIPLALRNAIFDEGNKETLLVVHTVISRSRAKNFGVSDNEIENYLLQKRDEHNTLLNAGKRK